MKKPKKGSLEHLIQNRETVKVENRLTSQMFDNFISDYAKKTVLPDVEPTEDDKLAWSLINCSDEEIERALPHRAFRLAYALCGREFMKTYIEILKAK